MDANEKQQEKQPLMVNEEIEVQDIESMPVKECPDISIEIYNLVKRGYTKTEIRAMYSHLKSKKWEAAWGRAQELLSDNVQEQETAKAEAITIYKDLLRRALRMGNIKEARNILDSLVRVQGINNEMNINADYVAIWK